MAAEPNELKQVLKETLANRGKWDLIKSELTTEVFNVLDDKTIAKPELTRENFLINELIREYLLFNNYKYTSHVLTQETGQPREILPHDILAKELSINEGPNDTLPLLYRMLMDFAADSNSSIS